MLNFIIVENNRLKFQNSEKVVKDFLRRRLEYFGANSVFFTLESLLPKALDETVNMQDMIAVLDIMNPIVDFGLIQKAVKILLRNELRSIMVDGAVPGTQFEYILAPGIREPDADIPKYYALSQNQFNNQFNLYKFKRLKQFLRLNVELPDLYRLDIDDLMEKLREKKIFNMLVCYSEDVEQGEYKVCPYCGSDLMPLPMTMSQPFCGYISAQQPIYHQCINCGLVVLSPYVKGDESYKLYDDFDTQDFVVSHNNPYHLGMKRCDIIENIACEIPENGCFLDLGGGIGYFSRFLKEHHPKWNVTHSDLEIKQFRELERRGIQTRSLNFMKEEIGREDYHCITAWEVIEHIPFEDFENVIERIWNALKPGGYFIFSTPDMDSPLCRMNDFFAICPPFHYVVYGKQWLFKYYCENGWRIVGTYACSDFLEDSEMWCNYISKTAPSLQLRSMAKVLNLLFEKKENRNLLLENEMGTEVIFVIQKPDYR